MILQNIKLLKVGKVLNKELKMHMTLLLRKLVKWFLKFLNKLNRKLRVLKKILNKEQHKLLKVLKLRQDIKVLNYNNKKKMSRKIFLKEFRILRRVQKMYIIKHHKRQGRQGVMLKKKLDNKLKRQAKL